MLDESNTCDLCRIRGIARAVYKVIAGIRVCGGCVADMPLWCSVHLRKQPPLWVKATRYRDDKHYCAECYNETYPEGNIIPAPLPPETPRLPPSTMPYTSEITFVTEAEAQPLLEQGDATVKTLSPEDIKKRLLERKTAPVEEVEEDEKEEEPVAKKFCACGCGGEISPKSKWNYLKGHKANPPSNPLASAASSVRSTRAALRSMSASIAATPVDILEEASKPSSHIVHDPILSAIAGLERQKERIQKAIDALREL